MFKVLCMLQCWCDVEGELEAVVGEADVGREDGVGGVVVEVVGHVGEEGAAGFELLDQRDGVFQGGVGGVGLAAEGVEDEDVEIGEQGKALGGDVAEVGEVGGGAEAVAGDGVAAMGDGDAEEVRAEEVDVRRRASEERRWRRDAGAGGVAVAACGRCSRRCARWCRRWARRRRGAGCRRCGS